MSVVLKREVILSPLAPPNMLTTEDGYDVIPVSQVPKEILEEMIANYRVELLEKAGYTP